MTRPNITIERVKGNRRTLADGYQATCDVDGCNIELPVRLINPRFPERGWAQAELDVEQHHEYHAEQRGR